MAPRNEERICISDVVRHLEMINTEHLRGNIVIDGESPMQTYHFSGRRGAAQYLHHVVLKGILATRRQGDTTCTGDDVFHVWECKYYDRSPDFRWEIELRPTIEFPIGRRGSDYADILVQQVPTGGKITIRIPATADAPEPAHIRPDLYWTPHPQNPETD